MKSLTNVILKNARRKEEKFGATRKEKILSVFSFGIVFVFLAIVMAIVSIGVTLKLKEIDQTYSFVNILLLMNFFILFAKSVFESLNVLYFSKDLKVFFRMPLKAKDILHAKLLNMIISEYPMEIIMLAIPMIVYGMFTNVSIVFYIYMIAVLLVLPIIPIMLTSFILSIIMRITNKIKNKSKVMYITIFMAVLIVSFITSLFNSGNLSMSVSGFENVILNANGLAESIADYFILIKPIMNTLLNYNNINGLINLGIYILESIALYIGILFIMSKIYFKGAIGTTINSNRSSKNNKILTENDFKKKRKNKSYILKEVKTMLRTPIFCIECLILPIAYPLLVFALMALFINFANSVGVDALGDFYERLKSTSGLAIFLSIGQVFYMMNFSSIIAVSRESKNSILIKYIPINFKTQFNLKLRIGIYTNTISSIIVAICYYACSEKIVNSFVIFIILMLLNLIGEKFKLLIDLRNPQIHWDSEYTMMKQNTNVMYELFYTLIVIAILAIISLVINKVELYLIFVFALTFIINTFINEYIHQKQDKIFKKVF